MIATGVGPIAEGGLKGRPKVEGALNRGGWQCKFKGLIH